MVRNGFRSRLHPKARIHPCTTLGFPSVFNPLAAVMLNSVRSDSTDLAPRRKEAERFEDRKIGRPSREIIFLSLIFLSIAE